MFIRYRCHVVCIWLIFWLLIFEVSSFSVEFQNEGGSEIASRRNQRMNVDQLNLYYPEYASIDGCKSALRLPIFPLRKAVKLPTEELTLNLYEERYLELASYVLQQRPNPCVFGALYCATKPQIASGATGPVTPLVEPGDIGAIFLVVGDEEGMIPSLGGSFRRRIRLNSVAIGRFRIEAILENGYAPGSRPFILVEASKLEDEMLAPGSEDEKFVVNLERDIRGKLTQLIDEVKGGPNEIEGEEKEFNMTNETNGGCNIYARDQLLKDDLTRHQHAEERYRREIFSFFALSQLKGSDAPPLDILKGLQSLSTKERLVFANQERKKLWGVPF